MRKRDYNAMVRILKFRILNLFRISPARQRVRSQAKSGGDFARPPASSLAGEVGRGFRISNLAGFTLLETIVAFAVIFAALIGPVSLITRGIIDVTFAKNKLVALNLAQEGIELVRLLRDNNVLCDFVNGATDVAWDEDTPGGGKIDPPAAGGTDLEADAINLNDLASPQNCPLISSPDFSNFSSGGDFLQQDSDGLYQYSSGPYTPFKRKITVETLTSPDRMRITSEVTWTERGRSWSVTLKDVLYNWK